MKLLVEWLAHVLAITMITFKILYLCILERGEKEKEPERNINMWLPHPHPCMPLTGEPARNPGMCPVWD